MSASQFDQTFALFRWRTHTLNKAAHQTPPGSNTRFFVGATLPISVTCTTIGLVRHIQFGPGLKSIQAKARSSRISLLPSRGPAVGGGIRGGQVYGSSDAQAAYPKSNPVSPEDVIATTYHALGISPESLIHDRENRPHKISDGRPLVELFG